jgi:hypothetical protein
MTMRLFLLLCALGACASDYVPSDDDPSSNPGDDPADDPAVANCAAGRSYVGIGGVPLEADRVPALAGADRLRLKPFSALAAEYARVLGNMAADVGAFRATFGEAPPRWFTEPDASANTLYASFSLAFQGCLAETAAAPSYGEAPTAATADATCRGFALRFWDRRPTDAEVAPCVRLATDATSAEADPRARWAYACAAVLTAAGFLSY